MALTAKPSVDGGKSMKILPCNCKHDTQDKTFGKGQRAHNPNKSGYKCTVCGNQKNK